MSKNENQMQDSNAIKSEAPASRVPPDRVIPENIDGFCDDMIEARSKENVILIKLKRDWKLMISGLKEMNEKLNKDMKNREKDNA